MDEDQNQQQIDEDFQNKIKKHYLDLIVEQKDYFNKSDDDDLSLKNS